jgi:hypothetical protein
MVIDVDRFPEYQLGEAFDHIHMAVDEVCGEAPSAKPGQRPANLRW